ncbi:MAG: hypothetical protein Q4G67_13300, partial [Actinomycetia bacterium]|nr:hypothetical protein [Actinomycetes bacterium]
MARDHARIRLDIWVDEDFTDLPSTSQWLYLRLLTHGGLTYCGVVEWRPNRLAQAAADLTAADVEAFAAVLEDRNFLVIDRESEECLVRSFVKHDGLLDKWNLAAAVARTFTAVASKPIRGVIVHELKRLRDGHPDYRGWSREDVQKLLRRTAIDPDDAREMTRPNPTVRPTER